MNIKKLYKSTYFSLNNFKIIWANNKKQFGPIKKTNFAQSISAILATNKNSFSQKLSLKLKPKNLHEFL